MWTYDGTKRPDIAAAPGPGQESVWDYPRPPRIEAERRPVRVAATADQDTSGDGTTTGTATCTMEIALSERALRVIETATGNGMIGDNRIAEELAQLRAEVAAARAMTYRNISEVEKRGQPGPEASVIRVFTSELGRRIETMGVRLMGEEMLDFRYGDDDQVQDYLRGFASTIAGGSSQIQRNIIGERMLGLPRSR